MRSVNGYTIRPTSVGALQRGAAYTVKDLGDSPAAYIDMLKAKTPSREISLAITNAEQSVMWAVKGLTA